MLSEALRSTTPSAVTRPAAIAACARVRLSNSPRSTRSTSARLRLVMGYVRHRWTGGVALNLIGDRSDDTGGMMIHAGGCLCSALRYETLAEPDRITFCHCRFCQRATGSAFM